MNSPRPLLPRIVPPAADLLDQHAGGQRGPADPRHFGGRERGGSRGEFGRRPADRLQVRRQTVPRIEHSAERPAEGLNLDRIEAERGQVVAEIRFTDRETGR